MKMSSIRAIKDGNVACVCQCRFVMKGKKQQVVCVCVCIKFHFNSKIYLCHFAMVKSINSNNPSFMRSKKFGR